MIDSVMRFCVQSIAPLLTNAAFPGIIRMKNKGGISELAGMDMDIELYHQEKGSGDALILLHGNGESSDYFKYQIDYFQRSYRVIALDTRGHGKSPRGNAPFTLAQFACDLYEFMQQHRISQAIILGFSDGANIAMQFALRHPERVKALILNGGNLNPAGVKRNVQIPIEIGYRIAKCFASKSAKAQRNAELLGLMVNEPHIQPSEFASLTMPALVICGTRDMIRESHTKQIAEALPNAKLAILPGDHFVARQNPAAFNRAVDAFLKTIG